MSDVFERISAALADRYRLERELGQGGMATVFLAGDLKHDRRVAIKVLKPELAAVLGAERFVVEIKTTASMSHPHILPLFDSGTADGFLFYVMPFIEGETLREKLNRERQCSVEEAVRIAREIADALDYAHRHGVIHRDIKPENILLHDGRAMVMDFGIALAVSAAAGGRMTETGLSLGTPHYMSPEQATADQSITGRSDVYSLGTLLYEMLAGDPPHTGSSAQQIIMKIITERAEPVTKYRQTVPPHVAAAIARALEKLPADRFTTAKALADALQDVHFTSVSLAGGAHQAGAGTGRGWLRDPRTVGALVMIVGLAAVAVMRGRQEPVLPPTLRLAVVGPPDSAIVSITNSRNGQDNSLGSPTVSADGRHVLFTITRPKGAELVLRSLDQPDLRVVADSGVNGAFFAPDGQRFGFFVGSNLYTASVTDAKPARLGRIPESDYEIRTASWHPDGRILIAGAFGLWAVPESGGDATLLVANRAPDRVFLGAQVLPDGRLLLSYASPNGPVNEVRRADGTKPETVLAGRLVSTVIDDILFFYRSPGALQVTRVNVASLTPEGPVVTLGDVSARLGRSIATADPTTLSLQPLLRSVAGVETPAPVPPSGLYRWPKLSPDGRQLAIGSSSGLRVFDLERRASWPMGGSTEPVWTADGSALIMSRGERPKGGLLRQVADGSRPPDTLLIVDNGDAWPTSVSADGAWLAYYGQLDSVTVRNDRRGDQDLFFLDLRTRASRRLALPGVQRGARFSPDGRWVAYTTFESGSGQVQLRDWPALASRYLISNDGGLEPTWSPDGRTLYYRRRGDVMAVAFAESGGRPALSPPRVLFTGTYREDPSGDQSYDVTPDGRFLFVKSLKSDRVIIDVTLNWIEEIRAKLKAAAR